MPLRNDLNPSFLHKQIFRVQAKMWIQFNLELQHFVSGEALIDCVCSLTLVAEEVDGGVLGSFATPEYPDSQVLVAYCFAVDIVRLLSPQWSEGACSWKK